MSSEALQLGPIWQLGFIVHDIDAVMRRWATENGVGPWLKVFDHAVQPNLLVRGVPTESVVSIAIAYTGEVMIELIEQHNDTETVYRPAMRSGNENLHHIAYLAEDFDATVAVLAERGHEPVMAGGANGTNYRYYDMGPIPGIYTEIVSVDPSSPRRAILDLKESSKGGDPLEVRRP